MPTSQEIDTAIAAMRQIQNRPAAVGSREVLLHLLGWQTKKLTSNDHRCVEGFTLTMRCCSGPALAHASRRLLAPRDTPSELEECSQFVWGMCRELVIGRMFVSRVLEGDGALAAEALLRQLAEARITCPREMWERAFRVALPRKTRWRPFDAPSRAAALRRRVMSSRGVRVADLGMRDVLTLAQPSDAIGEGWHTPLAYFSQSTLHFGEVLTTEGVHALASYLRARQQALGSTRPIVEVGAGLGRLTHLLNATGLVQVVATDPQPDDQCEPHNVAFPLDVMDAASSMRKYKPDIVLCAWMEFGQDFCADIRAARVAEYVLIGEVGYRARTESHATGATQRTYQVVSSGRGAHRGAGQTLDAAELATMMGSLCYSISLDPATHHPGYERVLLPEVSSELLHIHDAQDAEEGCADDPGGLVAAAFRRVA